MPGSSSKSPDTLDEETEWWVGTACELDDPVVRYRLRFFAQVGHETTYASSGNKQIMLPLDLPKLSREPTKIGHSFKSTGSPPLTRFSK